MKDTSLITEAMEESRTDAGMMRALNAGYREVVDAGRARDDMAAVVASFRNG